MHNLSFNETIQGIVYMKRIHNGWLVQNVNILSFL